jgi:hypothetical protein
MWFTATDLDHATQRHADGLDLSDPTVLDTALSTLGIDSLADILDIDRDNDVVEIDEAVIGTVPSGIVSALAAASPDTLAELAEDVTDDLLGVYDPTDALQFLTLAAEFCRAIDTTNVYWLLLP